MMDAGVAEAPEVLFKRIRRGQNSHVAVRKIVFPDEELGTPSLDGMANDLAAFANAHGGTLVLGVDEHNRKIARARRLGLTRSCDDGRVSPTVVGRAGGHSGTEDFQGNTHGPAWPGRCSAARSRNW